MKGSLTANRGFELELVAPPASVAGVGLPQSEPFAPRSFLPQINFPVRALFVMIGLALTLGLGSAILLVSVVGVVSPMDFRAEFTETLLPYSEAIVALDASFDREGTSEQFLAEVTQIIDQTTAYKDRRDLRTIPAKENWILWGLSHLQPALNYVGFSSQTLFTVYQAFSYEMALKRGFGMCGQLALAVTDLLNTRYGIQTSVLSLGGHVVALAQLPDGSQHILDSTVGVFLPYGPQEAALRIAEFEPLYQERGRGDLAQTFDTAGNVIYPRGARDLEPKSYFIEAGCNFMKWIAPVVLVLLGVLLMKFGFRHVTDNPAHRIFRPVPSA